MPESQKLRKSLEIGVLKYIQGVSQKLKKTSEIVLLNLKVPIFPKRSKSKKKFMNLYYLYEGNNPNNL